MKEVIIKHRDTRLTTADKNIDLMDCTISIMPDDVMMKNIYYECNGKGYMSMTPYSFEYTLKAYIKAYDFWSMKKDIINSTKLKKGIILFCQYYERHKSISMKHLFNKPEFIKLIQQERGV